MDQNHWRGSFHRLCGFLLFSVLIFGGFTVSEANAADDEEEFELEDSLPGETNFITINFGAEYPFRQMHLQFVDVMLEDPRINMISIAERDRRLRERFPEKLPPIVAGLEKRLDDGLRAFYEGDYTEATRLIEASMSGVDENLLALSLKEGFADLSWEAGLRLVMALDEPEQEPARDRIMAQMVKLFPTHQPEAMLYPPEIVRDYNEIFRPALANGYLLTIKVSRGCHALLNGVRLPPPQGEDGIEVELLGGKYGISEICEGITRRIFIVPMSQDETVDFEGDFALAFNFPQRIDIDARSYKDPKDLGKFIELLVTLGRRLEVEQVVAAGIFPSERDEDESQYRLYLVDIPEGRLIRDLSLPLTQIPTDERKGEAIHSMLTGDEFEIIGPPIPPKTDWTTVGIWTAAAGGGGLLVMGTVFALIAEGNNDDFIECSSDPTCRGDLAKRTSLLQDRNQNALIADIMFGVGGAAVVAGVSMILVHQLSGRSEEEEVSEEDNLEEYEGVFREWSLGLAPSSEGGLIRLDLTF